MIIWNLYITGYILKIIHKINNHRKYFNKFHKYVKTQFPANPTFTGILTASTTTINGTLTTTNTIVENTLTIKGKDTYGDYTFKSILNDNPNNNTDKLVLAKKNSIGNETVIMEMSQDGTSALNQVDTVTFSAPVVMASSLVLSNLPTSGDGLLTGQIYMDNLGFLRIKI